MELTTETRKIIRSSEGESVEGKFTIKASAQAFSILSDRLYSDKITAILRELSCNAADAHTAAGCPDLPFEIWMPSWQSPQFCIRDFGTGLSKDSIENVYTTYFESTKANSNDFIGCLGLGSKTPFSYTDSFLVESFYKGTKFTYTAFINEEGVPSLRSLAEEPTNENNGLRVSFAVKHEDFNNFEFKAKEVFRWFKVRPIIKGSEYFRFGEIPEFSKIGDDWDLYKNSPQAISYVRMGNVVYPISVDKFPQDFPDELKSILSNSIIFHCDIGDVDIAPSREALVYNKKTVARLKSRIERFAEEITEDLNAELKAVDCWYDACLLALEKGWFDSSLIGSFIDQNLVHYKKQKLTRSIHNNDISSIIEPHFNVNLKHFDSFSLSKYLHSFYFSKDFSIIEINEKIHDRKLKEILHFNKIKNCYVVNTKNFPCEKTLKLMDLFGIDEKYIKVFSDLSLPPLAPKKPKAPASPGTRSSVGKKSSAVWRLSTNPSDDKPRSAWSTQTETIDLEDKTEERYYLTIKNFQITAGQTTTHKLDSVGRYALALRHMRTSNPNLVVYGLTERQEEKITFNKKWVNFDVPAGKYFTDLYNNHTLKNYYEWSIITKFSKELFTIILASKNEPLKDFVEEMKAFQSDHDKIHDFWTYLPRTIGLLVEEADPNYTLIKNVMYGFPYGENQSERIKELDPDSFVLKFIEECKKHKILMNYCQTLRNHCDTRFDIADAVRILDLNS